MYLAFDFLAGYPKVVKILKGRLIPVNEKHRKTMDQCAKHIYERLSTTDTLPYLIQGGVIKGTDAEEIRSIENVKGRGYAAMDLLFMLPNRDRKWFSCFLKALRKSNQTDLAEIIDKTSKEYYSTSKMHYIRSFGFLLCLLALFYLF